MSAELPQLIFMLALGVWIGGEFKLRRRKSTNELFGKLISDSILAVYEHRKFVGSGVELSRSFDLDMPDGRKVQVVVREAA